MQTTLPLRPKLNERIKVALAAGEKRRIFEIAASRGTTASEFIRHAIALASSEAGKDRAA
jgi:hypothetical protein